MFSDYIFLMGGNFLISFLCFIVFVFILIRGDKTFTHKYLAVLNLTLCIWCLGNFLINLVKDDLTALIVHRVCYAFGVLFIPSFLFMVYSIRGKKDSKKFIYTMFVLVGICLLFLPTRFFISGFNLFTKYNLRQSSPGFFYYIFAGIFSFYVSYCLYMLLQIIKSSKTLYKRNQAIFALICYGTFSVGGSVYFLCIFKILNWYSPAGYFGSVGIISLFYSLIWKDLNLTFKYIFKSLIQLFILISYAVLVWIVYSFINIDFLKIAISSALILTYIPVHNKVNSIFNKIFLKEYFFVWAKLLEISKSSTRNQITIEDIISLLSNKIKDTVGITTSFVYTWNSNIRKYEVYHEKDCENRTLLDEKNVLINLLYNSKKYVYKETLYSDDNNQELISEMEKLGVTICFPIVINDILSYVFCYGKKVNSRIYLKEEIELLGEIIKESREQIVSINRFNILSHNFAKSTKEDYQILLLRESKTLSNISDEDELLKNVKNIISRLLYSKNIQIFIYDEVEKTYKSQDNNIKIPPSNYLIKQLIQSNTLYQTEMLKEWSESIQTKDATEAYETAKKLGGTIIAPITNGSFLGFISLGEKSIPQNIKHIINVTRIDNRYTKEDIYSLLFILDRTGIALHNILINKKLIKDHNLNIFNRTYLTKKLSEHIEMIMRDGGSLSLIILDGDNFKLFNEINHDFGDSVLRVIRDVILETIRPADNLFRWGGEEFVVLLPSTRIDDAVTLGNRIKKVIEADSRAKSITEEYRKNKGVSIKLSLTMGVSTFISNGKENYEQEDIETISQTIFCIADTYMLKGKHEGKARVVKGEEFSKGYIFDKDGVFKEQKKLLIASKNIASMNDVKDLYINITESLEPSTLGNYTHAIIDEEYYLSSSEDLSIFINRLRQFSRSIKLGVLAKDSINKRKFLDNGVTFFISPIYSEDIINWLK